MRARVLLSTIACLTMSACAPHLTEQQCMAMDWKSEGFKDGSMGKAPRNLSQPVEDCAKFNIVVNQKTYKSGWHLGLREYCGPDATIGYADGFAGKPLAAINVRNSICEDGSLRLNLDEYLKGRQKGLSAFCTYENGMNLARQGSVMPTVCEGQLQGPFASGFGVGKQQFCNQTANAFALGKENKPYPVICAPEMFPPFKAEYDRGIAINQRAQELRSKINEIDKQIADDTWRNDLNKLNENTYELGSNHSDKAKAALGRIYYALNQKETFKSELFNLQVMR